MTRDEARARLRAMLEPLRPRVAEVFDMPDLQDAIRLYEISLRIVEAGPDPWDLAKTAGWDLLMPIDLVFEEDS